MNVYKIPIEYAFVTFPFIAFILTIPFLIHQYRKFGSIHTIKSLCFYSLILYLLCAYFLVILPLPSVEKVSHMTGPISQLTPFQFVKDIIETTSFNISKITDIINIFKNSTVYTILFNIILTLPFGVYLRYFFRKKWYYTILYTFLLSLFFELTQLTGLYGIYPRPYRIFDVDDLLVNTFGGLIGHSITPLIVLFVPSLDEIEARSYKKGTRVTLPRRFVALTIDLLFILIFNIIAKILLYGTILSKGSLLIVITLYCVIIPTFTSGKTIGKTIVNLRLTSITDIPKWYQILLRNFLLVYIILYPFAWINLLSENIDENIIIRLWSIIIICQVTNILYYLYTISFKKTHLFLYEKITQTQNESIIIKNKESDNCKKEEKHDIIDL